MKSHKGTLLILNSIFRKVRRETPLDLTDDFFKVSVGGFKVEFAIPRWLDFDDFLVLNQEL